MIDILEGLPIFLKEHSKYDIKDACIMEEKGENSYRGCKTLLQVDVSIQGISACLIIGFPEEFPAIIPLVFVENGQLGFIPHIEQDGMICYTRNETLILDERYPADIVLECFERAVFVIEQGMAKRNFQDFQEEFEVYWARQDGCQMIYSIINEQNEQAREICVWEYQTNHATYFFAADSNVNARKIFYSIFSVDIKEALLHQGFYFPLKHGTALVPPQYNTSWSMKELRDKIWDNLTISNKNKFRKLVSGSTHRVQYRNFIIAGFSTPRNTRCLFGMVCTTPLLSQKAKMNKTIKKIHPFLQTPKDYETTPLSVRRYQQRYLIERTGGQVSISNKHVVVVGVGAIGSPIAAGLAKAGIQQITLVDYDRLDIDNIHRHELGATNVFWSDEQGNFGRKQKVQAMRQHIESHYPFTNVTCLASGVEDVLRHNQVNWEQVDLVIVAIGSPNIEMLINRFMHNLQNSPPVMYTWVEPLGIGGHVLVTLNRTKQGCYQCLFRSLEEGQPISNLAAFAASGQSFSKAMTGCGSYFTPYSFLDSEETANLSLRTAFRVLMNQEEDNPVLSWKGNAQMFAESGYQLSQRYQMTAQELYDRRLLYKNEACPICQRRK